MATLRERLTPQEQQRFKQLYQQGYFDEITLNRFTQRLGRELRFIDYQTKQLERAGWPHEHLGERPQFPFTNPLTKHQLRQMREKAFDTALQGERTFFDRAFSGERTRQDLQDLDRGLGMRPDGTLLPRDAGLFAGADADKSIAERAWDRYWEEQGIVGGIAEIAGSSLTAPVRGAGHILSGSLGEHPLEATAAVGSVLPIGRALGRLAGASRRLSPVGRVARSGWLQIPAQGAEIADILGAREDVYVEALSEGGLEAIGAGGDVIADLRSGRLRRIWEGFDPQAAEDAQTTASTTEHDNITGSKTAPGVIPDSVARAAADSAVESADAQTAQWQAHQQTSEEIEQELRRQAWERMLAQAEKSEAAAAEQAAREQRFIDADDAYTERQAAEAVAAEEQAAAEAEKIEYTKTWLPFYSDLAGGSQSEGIRLLNQEYAAGVRDPIAHRYDTIAAGLQQQMGVAPSELHREADRRLQQQISEKWYNIYRGIDQRPTPQERVARAEAAAEQIVEGGTDDTTRTDQGTQQGAPQGTQPDATGVDNRPTGDPPDPRDSIPPARIGNPETGYASDGTTGHRVRPVLRELDDLVPSHQLDGQPRDDYPQDLQPREGRGGAISMEQVRNTARNPNFAFLLEFFKQFRDGAPVTSKKHPRRVVSGNGRTLALQLMRNEYPENWEGYQQALRAELEKVGIDLAEADAMENPVLTYELMDDTDEVALATDANVQTTLDNTAGEQAAQDAAYFDDDLMALWQPGEGNFDETLQSEANQSFRTALFNRIPTHLVAAFMTADNKNFSNDGIQRIQNAMIRYVFGGEIGDQLSRVFIETGLEGIKNIETMVRNAIASLAYAKANGQDISQEMASAIFRFIEINNTAEREAQQRRVPKEALLYAGIDAVYKTAEMLQAPAESGEAREADGSRADTGGSASRTPSPLSITLLEKQLLYLIYSKRNAPRQLADDFQDWARTVVSLSASTEASLFDVQTSTAIFAGMIRNYIRETIFATRQTQDGQTVLVSPDSLPPELVDLRLAMDAMSDTADKERFANDWIDAFLRMMNSESGEAREADGSRADTGGSASRTPSPLSAEGEPQNETEIEPADGSVDAEGEGTPRGEGTDLPQGTPDMERDPGTPETPGRREGVAGDQQPQPGRTQGDEPEGTPGESEDDASRRGVGDAIASATETTPGPTPQEETQTPIDTNQVVGVSRRVETQDTPTVSPIVQRDLDTLGVTVAQWQQMKADGEAIAFINSLSSEQQEQVEWGVNLIADMERGADAQAQADAEAYFDDDEDWDIGDEDDFFSDVDTGVLKDITDQQRSDFETVRRKLFLAKAIARLEAKGQDRTPIETAQLRALTAPQRTDAQQEIYERLLTAFVGAQVTRLSAKPQRSATENRILEALTAVQAEGLPEEASDKSLYADLETPDQEHSRPLAETRTLAGVQAPDTADTELNLPESVTADTTKLSPAQQTSVKAIIAAFKRKIHTDTDTTVQGGFLLGDKPGVGKTRQALATIWHYLRSGINRHFILAPNQQILNNFRTDMQAMGGPANDISHYDSSNTQLDTPIGTATYSMITRKPDLANFATASGTQNAIADIVEHLTGVRPVLQQTHPEHYTKTLEAYRRILSNVEIPSVENVIAELRRQAETVNLDNAAHVENFRQRVTPVLGDLLLTERTQEGQQEMFEGSELAERVKQLLAFAETHLAAQPPPDFTEKAAAFEGVIILDEMHKTAGTDSQIGETIATLDALLPNAKFLYMSATPFKEINNFWIADRLGLWGANQPFPSFDRFRRAFSRAARAVKEVVPLHLKQIGRYLSRALSAKETRYAPVEVPLTDADKAQYDTAVQFVQGVRQQFEAAIAAAERTPWGSLIENEGQFHQYRAHYMKMFYGGMQHFFLAGLDAMKAQGLEADIKEKLQAGDKIIVQLENTWDATEKRAAQRGQSSAGPFDLLIDFVENDNTFPVHEFMTEVRTRQSDGSQYTVVVPREVYNDNGQRVRAVDPKLKRLQTQLLDMLKAEMHRTGDLSFAADIIHAIAAEAGAASGEISGRRNTDRKALATAFSETTDLNLIVLGPAGLTGINLPVLENIKDAVGGLYHYLLQSSWNVNTFEQGLGRGKRSNSAIDPQYQIVYQDLPGADRVLGATLAKFAEMGALAGQADNALMQNIDKVEGETSLDDDPEAEVETDVQDVFEEDTEGERSHVFGVHGQEALYQLWMEMLESNDTAIADALGLVHPEYAGGTGYLDPDTVPSVQQFFQRLLHQSTEAQPRIYQEFESRLKRIIAYRRELGELDVGANDLNSKDGQIVDRLTIFTDPDTGQTAEMVKLSVKRKLPRRSWDFAQKVIRGEEGYEQHGRNFAGIYTDADGHVWAVFEAPFRKGDGETEYIRWGPRGTPVQGIHQGEHRLIADNLVHDLTPVVHANRPQLTDLDEAQRLWEAEDQAADTFVDSELFMATGLILPKWNDLSTRNTQHALMAVIPMLDGSQLHGRVIPPGAISEVLTQIGGVDPNHFSADRQPQTANREERTADSDIDIPSIVRDIIGEATDPRVAARLERIVEHIHKKLPLRLRGHRVRDAAEAALLGQLIRDPQVEHTWIVYRKDDRIVKIEPMSLNRKGETQAGEFAHIKKVAAKEKADSVLRIHNHPSGVAKWSPADKRAAMQWHRELGTLMAEDIIVDSGTYAYRTFENGEYTWHEDTLLDAETVGWDTGAQTVADASGEQKPTDVLYQNPLIQGAREAATYMMGLKQRTDVAELIFIDPKTGKITDTVTDPDLRTSRDDMEIVSRMKTLLARHPGQHVHVMMWGGTEAFTTAKVLMKNEIDGMDSVWVNNTRGQGIETIHISDQGEVDPDTGDVSDTIDVNIGGQDHTLIRVPDDDSETDTDTDTLSDVITDLITDLKKWWDTLTTKQKSDIQKKRKFTKPVIIAGVQHELHPDTDRRLRHKYDRGIDLEHMTSGNEARVFEQILQSGVIKATHPIGPAAQNAYFSYGPYYRRNTTQHKYGVILDAERLLRDMQDIVGTFHKRGTWSQRHPINSVKDMRQFLRAHQIEHPDTVIELQVPRDVDINKYLVGVVIDDKVYAKEEYLVENQLTRENVEAQFSKKQLQHFLRSAEAKNRERSKPLKRMFSEAIAAEKQDLARKEQELRETPRSEYPTLARNIEEDIKRRKQNIKDLENWIPAGYNIKAWDYEGISYDEKNALLKELQQRQEDIHAYKRRLRNINNPRKKRRGVLLRDIILPDENTLLSDYTAAVERTNPDSVVYRVHAPEQLAMEGRGRAKTAEIGEKALNTFMDTNAGIMRVLKAWSPTARRWARFTKNEFVSGFGRLTELEAPQGSDAPAPADVLKEILRERQHISKLNAGRALSTLEPHLLAFNDLAKKRTRLWTTAAAPGTRKATRMAMSHKVWNFIEYDTRIKNDPELLSVAMDLKNAWRDLLIYDTQKIVELMGELEKINEKLYVTDAQGKQVEWYSESFDGFEWDPETKGYTKDRKSYTIEAAHRAADKLYMPHYFRGQSPLQEHAAVKKMQDALNTLLAKDNITPEELTPFEIEYDADASLYRHMPTGKTAATPYEMVRVVANYVSNEDASLKGILNYYESEGRVGYYGHLERTRETDDRFYIRDISLMAENRIRLWDRLAEVATLGQQHPLLGDSPRMKTLIEQVLNFNKTPREAALRKVAEALNSGQEGMFQRMPQFASGVDTALDIMQHWLERDAAGEKTGRYQEIDIGRMNLDDATQRELERIGLIEKDGDGWKVVGADIAQRHATLARHIHEFYETLARRKNAVHSLVLGLGNWHTRDPLEMESSAFWKQINDTITVLTLNHGVAIQNLLEIPLISMLTGANPLFKGLKNMTNKAYRDQMGQLARGLSHARKFMADTTLADKYLGSPLTFFSKSDEFSRAAGLGIGLENAKAKIQAYAAATSEKRRAALGREMDAVRLNTDVVASLPTEQLASVLEAAEQLILNNAVETVFSSEKGGDLSPAERLAGTILRSMFYVSDETFKQYDATSLPQFMISRNPLIRVFMKYKSWMLQQNRLVYNQLRRAYREAKQGNLKPFSDFVAATAMMGLGTGGLLWLYSALQGDDDDKTARDRLFKGLAAAQTFGIASVMFELGMYAEGNWYQMSNLLAKQAAGPTFSVAAQMVGPLLTGDFAQAGEEAVRRLPIVSFSRRVGGWRLLEEVTGTGEEE